ncbi:hypothetical protein [Naasia sp. SYSU D00948]|uniref:hypothetical protein n=1 Tax=Naasia sp. SYSU D00948 TaxID=2817379 RepID=UPI001B3076DE|nr:hypothetical protein [Naasia sp. SYSU D00948]
MPSRSLRPALALLLGAALLPGLAGCGFNPVESFIEGATGGGVDLGGNQIPEGFPSDEVPLYDGEVTYGIAIGDEAGKAFNVTIRVPDAAAGEQIRSDLEAAGFTLLGGTDPTSQGGAAYDGENWSVVVVLTQESDSSWLANYTVTPKNSTAGTQ